MFTSAVTHHLGSRRYQIFDIFNLTLTGFDFERPLLAVPKKIKHFTLKTWPVEYKQSLLKKTRQNKTKMENI